MRKSRRVNKLSERKVEEWGEQVKRWKEDRWRKEEKEKLRGKREEMRKYGSFQKAEMSF